MAYTPPDVPQSPDARGRLVLSPDDADFHGGTMAAENRAGQPNIGSWDNARDWASWKVHFDRPGRYAVRTACAALDDGTEFVVEIAGQQLVGRAARTGSWDKFAGVNLGIVEVKAGDQTVALARGRRRLARDQRPRRPPCAGRGPIVASADSCGNAGKLGMVALTPSGQL